MTKDQAQIAATLCKLAYVSQIAKCPAKRDADFRAIDMAQIHALIEYLETRAAD
jgi:hypothetical protein